MLKPTDLGGDEDVARRVISTARSIAPCIDSLEDGPGDDDPKPKSEATSILKAIATEITGRGSRQIAAQGMGPANVKYNVGSFFSDDDRGALRALCSAATPLPRDPIGSFPAPSRAIHNMWPEHYWRG